MSTTKDEKAVMGSGRNLCWTVLLRKKVREVNDYLTRYLEEKLLGEKSDRTVSELKRPRGRSLVRYGSNIILHTS
jgi:hypothetical protein